MLFPFFDQLAQYKYTNIEYKNLLLEGSHNRKFDWVQIGQMWLKSSSSGIYMCVQIYIYIYLNLIQEVGRSHDVIYESLVNLVYDTVVYIGYSLKQGRPFGLRYRISSLGFPPAVKNKHRPKWYAVGLGAEGVYQYRFLRTTEGQEGVR